MTRPSNPASPGDIITRPTQPRDDQQITDMCRRVYRFSEPWTTRELALHRRIFPRGQLVAVERDTQRVLGFAASLIVHWDDYEMTDTWMDFTAGGSFKTHDPTGRTLYGADVMVHPDHQGRGVGKIIYAARRQLVNNLNLLRIRAGARLRGYHRHAHTLTPTQYVRKVVRGELTDPTLTFQLNQGFHVLAVTAAYLRDDPDSRGYAAVIEWLNENLAKPHHYAARDTFLQRQPATD